MITCPLMLHMYISSQFEVCVLEGRMRQDPAAATKQNICSTISTLQHGDSIMHVRVH